MLKVQIGQKVHCILYGGRDGIIYKIDGEQRPETIQRIGGCGVMGGSAQIYIVFDNGGKSCIPESILHGVQWRIFDEFATEEEIKTALLIAEETEARRRREAAAEKERQERERDRITREYPFLTKVQDSKRLGSHAVGAKNIKKELTRRFPGIAFSVKSESYSGGCSIDIHWTDGPSLKEVKEITSKYEEGSFNGMEDIYEYNHSNVWPDIYGGAKYVSESRDYSKDAQEVIAGKLNINIAYSQFGGIEFEDEHDRIRFHRTIDEHSFYEQPKEMPAALKVAEDSSAAKPAPASIQEGPAATSRQLWALHCITKLDTRKCKVGLQYASELISKANSGMDIRGLVRGLLTN